MTEPRSQFDAAILYSRAEIAAWVPRVDVDNWAVVHERYRDEATQPLMLPAE